MFVEYFDFCLNFINKVFDFHEIAILIFSFMLSETFFTQLDLAMTVLGDADVSEWQGVMLTIWFDFNFVN